MADSTERHERLPSIVTGEHELNAALIKKDGKEHFEQDHVQRYKDMATEEAYRVFMQPSVPPSMIAFYGISLIAVVLAAGIANADTRAARTDAPYPALTLVLFLVAFVSSFFIQIFLVVAQRLQWATVPRLLLISDTIFVLAAAAISFFEAAVLPVNRKLSDCGVILIYSSHNDVPEYKERVCNPMVIFGVIMTALLVIRRQRFLHVLILSVIVIMHVLFMMILTSGDAADAVHIDTTDNILALPFKLAMLTFACVVRYVLESAERRHFETQWRQTQRRDAVRAANEEVEEFVRSILPPVMVERARLEVRTGTLDSSKSAIMLRIGIADFAAVSERFLAHDLVTEIKQWHSYLTDTVNHSHSRLHRVTIQHDEILVVGNLMVVADPVACLLEACSLAERMVTVEQQLKNCGVSLPARAAITVCSARGGFVGSEWVRYDVFSDAEDGLLAALHSSDEGQVVLTEDAKHLGTGHVEVRVCGEYYVEETPRELFAVVAATTVGEYSRSIDDVVSELQLRNSTGESHVAGSHANPLQIQTAESSENSSTSNLTDLMNGSGGDRPSRRASFSLNRALELKQAEAALDAVDPSIELVRKWLFFRVFSDPVTEDVFLRSRMARMTERAVVIWIAYAFMQGAMLIMLLVDFPDGLGFVSALLFLVAIMASLVVAYVAKSSSAEQMHKRHTPWSILALFSPLFPVFALAFARPSFIGVGGHPMMLFAPLVRSPCLYHARHEVVLIPLFFIIGQLEATINGGIPQSVILIFFLVLYTVLSDSEVDLAQRKNFINEKRMAEALDFQEREKAVREGLVRSTLPAIFFQTWKQNKLPTVVRVSSVNDTWVVLVSWKAMDAAGPLEGQPSNPLEAATQSLAPVEAAADASEVLTIIQVIGDTAMLATSIRVPGAKKSKKDSGHPDNNRDRVFATLSSLTKANNYSALVDMDTSIQVIWTHGLPSFTMMGVVVSRLLAVHAAGGVGHGLAVLERAMPFVRGCPHLESYQEELQPPRRIRGAGLLRVVKFLDNKAVDASST